MVSLACVLGTKIKNLTITSSGCDSGNSCLSGITKSPFKTTWTEHVNIVAHELYECLLCYNHKEILYDKWMILRRHFGNLVSKPKYTDCDNIRI